MYQKLSGDYDEPIDPFVSRDPFAGQSADVSWSGYSAPVVTYPAIDTGSGWNWGNVWSGIKDVAVPLSTAAANLIRATSGKPAPVPSGYIRDASGRLVPTSLASSNWLIPALIAGGVGLWYFSKKR